ncbi:hypothetical protein ACTFIU_003260 [Dictyostelium citrinum]
MVSQGLPSPFSSSFQNPNNKYFDFNQSISNNYHQTNNYNNNNINNNNKININKQDRDYSYEYNKKFQQISQQQQQQPIYKKPNNNYVDGSVGGDNENEKVYLQYQNQQSPNYQQNKEYNQGDDDDDDDDDNDDDDDDEEEGYDEEDEEDYDGNCNSEDNHYDNEDNNNNNHHNKFYKNESIIINNKYYEIVNDRIKFIKQKLQFLEKNPKFQSIREKSFNFINEFTGESVVNGELGIRGSKDFSFLKYKTLNASLDNYITQERIELKNPLIKANIEKLKKDFNFEIGKINRTRYESLEIMKSIQQLSTTVRSPLLDRFDLKAQRNHIHGFFTLLIAHQKCLSFDFIYQMRPQSMDHQHGFSNTFTDDFTNGGGCSISDKKNRRTLNDQYKSFITDYFKNHSDHPYPNEEEKIIISALIDLSKYQRNNWFSNKRSREKNQRIVNLKKQKGFH